MPAIGFGLAWAGYTLGLLGWCKVKGYDVTFGDLVMPGRLTSWPPPGGSGIGVGRIPADQLPKKDAPAKPSGAAPPGTVAA